MTIPLDHGLIYQDHPLETNTSNWLHHKKNVFISSNAGKPIWTRYDNIMHDDLTSSSLDLSLLFSRYGDESRISSLMGVIQAIISFFQDGDDAIKYVFEKKEME